MVPRSLIGQLRLGLLLAMSLFAGAIVSDLLGDHLQDLSQDGASKPVRLQATELADI